MRSRAPKIWDFLRLHNSIIRPELQSKEYISGISRRRGESLASANRFGMHRRRINAVPEPAALALLGVPSRARQDSTLTAKKGGKELFRTLSLASRVKNPAGCEVQPAGPAQGCEVAADGHSLPPRGAPSEPALNNIRPLSFRLIREAHADAVHAADYVIQCVVGILATRIRRTDIRDVIDLRV